MKVTLALLVVWVSAAQTGAAQSPAGNYEYFIEDSLGVETERGRFVLAQDTIPSTDLFSRHPLYMMLRSQGGVTGCLIVESPPARGHVEIFRWEQPPVIYVSLFATIHSDRSARLSPVEGRGLRGVVTEATISYQVVQGTLTATRIGDADASICVTRGG